MTRPRKMVRIATIIAISSLIIPHAWDVKDVKGGSSARSSAIDKELLIESPHPWGCNELEALSNGGLAKRN